MSNEQAALAALESLLPFLAETPEETIHRQVRELRFIRWFENESRQAAAHRGLN